MSNEISAFARQPKRPVSIRRDNGDFVVAVQPENVIVFWNQDAHALRKACAFLRWQIVSDASLFTDDPPAVESGDNS
jgi:hypothetical protein